MKNSADRGGCYPPKLKAEVDKFLDDVIEPASLVQYDSSAAGFSELCLWFYPIRNREIF